MNTTDFQERQSVAPWVYFVVAIAGLAAAYAPFPDSDLHENLHQAGWALLVVPFLLLLVNLLSAVTRIGEGKLRFHLGWLFPMFWKRIPLDAIEEHFVVQYRPLRDAGGWGIRFGRFNGKRTTFLSARGNRGVCIRAGGKQYIIGSQDPEALDAALSAALSGPEPPRRAPRTSR